MGIAIESLLFLLAGVLLVLILTRAFARPTEAESSARAAPGVKLVRSARTAEGHEETRLLVNDKVILAANNDGVRLAEYASEVEQLEAVAARMAAALGVNVEFARVGVKRPDEENGILVRDLPRISDEDLGEPVRRPRMDRGQGAG